MAPHPLEDALLTPGLLESSRENTSALVLAFPSLSFTPVPTIHTSHSCGPRLTLPPYKILYTGDTRFSARLVKEA